MRERLARLLSQNPGLLLGILDKDHRSHLDALKLVDALLKELREPTDAMRFAVPPRIAEKLSYRDIGDTFKSMIDRISDATEN